MVSDEEIAQMESEAQTACADHPARRAAVRRLIAHFRQETLWPFDREGHLKMLKIIAWPEGTGPQLLPFNGGLTVGQR